jgi:hypothetical protein
LARPASSHQHHIKKKEKKGGIYIYVCSYMSTRTCHYLDTLPWWIIEIEIFVVLEGFGLADWSISGDVKAPMGSSSKTTNLLCFMFYEL